jgi:hypothetical protein
MTRTSHGTFDEIMMSALTSLTPPMETTENGYTTDVINNVIDPSSTMSDPNNNNIKSALSIPCQPRRRSISTPNPGNQSVVYHQVLMEFVPTVSFPGNQSVVYHQVLMEFVQTVACN